MQATRSQSSTSSTTLSSGRVRGDGGDVFDSADSETRTSQGTEGRLTTGTGGLGLSTTGGSELDVDSGDTDFLALSGNVLGSQHGGVGRRFVSVGLNLHTTSNSGDGFLARQIGDVDEGVVERSENTGNAEHLVSGSYHVSHRSFGGGI